jgi:hypothetical protein
VHVHPTSPPSRPSRVSCAPAPAANPPRFSCEQRPDDGWTRRGAEVGEWLGSGGGGRRGEAGPERRLL